MPQFPKAVLGDLEHVPLCCCQVTLLQATAGDKKLAELPAYKELLSTFTTQEARMHSHVLLSDCFCPGVLMNLI